MSSAPGALPFEELIDGETFLRLPPPDAHEQLVARLHRWVAASLPRNSALVLLRPRAPIELATGHRYRPDLTLVHRTEGTPWLVVEVLHSLDHHIDTVYKKTAYAAVRVARLWMVDPRYQNVETYASGEYGFRLEAILAQDDRLTDPAIPAPGPSMRELFSAAPPPR